MQRVLCLGLLVGLVGCSAGEAPGDHAAGEELLREVGEAVTCGASLLRYPVGGPHNGGYDKNALTYTCPAHPAHAPDNSDFIGGDHFGNDIFGAKGTPIVAPVNGTVVKAGWDTTGGNRVTVKDGCGWYYYHAHLDSIAVSVGQGVSAGQVLGTLGNSGSAQGTSPHLHFSIYPGVYEQGIDPFPLLAAVDGTSCQGQCKAHCEGSKIFGADCGSGDCGVYGATCVDDQKGVRCASVFCPALGQKKVCIDDKLIGDCNDGAISAGDCSAYAAHCVDDAKGARCVSVFCDGKPGVAHDVCLPNGQLAHCTALGGIAAEDCAAGKQCKDAGGGAKCLAPGAGGSGGSGGSAGAGGTAAASGGEAGEAGAGGSAGAGEAGASASPVAPKDGTTPIDEGCALGVGPKRSPSPVWVALVGLLVASRRWRRASARRAACEGHGLLQRVE